MILNLAVGQQGLLTPGGPPIRGSYDGSVVTQDVHARYQEAVYRGNVWSSGQTTATTIPAGLSASPTTTTLFNPAGSGVIGVVWYVSVTNLVAWPAGAMVWVASSIGGAATTGTAGLVTNQLSGVTFGSKLKPLTTATIAAAPTNVVMALGVGGGAAAITVAPQIAPMGGWMDGILFCPPGNTLSIQATTVGGTTGSFGFWIWEEVPTQMG